MLGQGMSCMFLYVFHIRSYTYMFVLFEWQGLSSLDGRYLCNLVYLRMLVDACGHVWTAYHS
jgi:hypothetical protein